MVFLNQMLKTKLYLYLYKFLINKWVFFVLYTLFAISLSFFLKSDFLCETEPWQTWRQENEAIYVEETNAFPNYSLADKKYLIEREKTNLWSYHCPHNTHYVGPVLEKHAHYLEFMPDKIEEQHKYLNQVYSDLHSTRYQASQEECYHNFANGVLFLGVIILVSTFLRAFLGA